MKIQYEEELYSIEEEVGYITLALVLEGDAIIPVSVTVSTLGLLDSSVGDAATGELHDCLINLAKVEFVPAQTIETTSYFEYSTKPCI